jgi:arabinofuranan 3-O-arabinosyltransferase
MTVEQERLRRLTVIAALLFLIFGGVYLATLDLSRSYPRDGTGLIVGRDFLNFWMYGRAAFEPHPAHYYDVPTYWAATEKFVGKDYPTQLWSYPPHLMLLAAPFGQLPYFVALALWMAISFALFVLALRLWSKDWRFLVPCAFAPAAIFGIISGQVTYAVAAAVLAILRWRESRPWLAGLLLGLMTMKPQLGLFYPVLLLSARNWRTISAAAAVTLALAGVSALLWGSEIWTAYFQHGIANQSMVLSDPEKLGGPFMPTLFMNARLAGLSVQGAMAVQLVGTATALLVIWMTFRHRPEPSDLRANTIFLAAAVFGTPYMLSYDTLALTTFAVLLMAPGGGGRLLTLLVWLLPLFQLAAGRLNLPGPALIPLFAAFYLLKAQTSSTWVDQRN